MLHEFHEKFGGAINQPITEQLKELRIELIDEEFLEVIDELDAPKIDKAKLTKELADLLYVVIGAATTFGLPLEEAFKEVHRSNMSKLGEDGKPIYREDGKVLKGPNFSPANMEQFFPKPE